MFASLRPSLFLRNLAGFSLLASLALAADPSATSPQLSAERNYRLFVGVDVEVWQDENFHTVTSYDNNRVQAAGEMLPLDEVEDLRFNFAPKLSRQPLTISKVSTKRVPAHLLTQLDAMRNQQALDAFATEQTDAAESALRRSTGSELSGPGMDNLPQVIQPDAGTVDVAAVFSNLSFENSTFTNPVDHAERIAGAESAQNSALEITARIASPYPIEQAYAMGVINIATDDNPEQSVLFMERLGAIGPKPRKFRTIKMGLPPQFTVNEVDIHVFARGEELVSDQSKKQIAITEDQVRQYLLLLHVQEHKRNTLPAAPVWSLAPPELLAIKKPEPLDHPCYLRIDAEGQLASVENAAELPARVREILDEMFFVPALHEGEPMASSLTLNLREFFN